jgi:hypothetical protein
VLPFFPRVVVVVWSSSCRRRSVVAEVWSPRGRADAS